MPSKDVIARTKRQEVQAKSERVTSLSEQYLEPLVEGLDAYLDKRLVQTFLQGIRTIIEARKQTPGLVISELAARLLSGREATAGEKRIHRLLASEKWSEERIKVFQWNEAQNRYEELRREAEQVFVIWDGSVIEKPALALMDFWSRKGPEATTASTQEAQMVEQVARRWGKHVLHIFDRGYAGGPWLELMWRYELQFLLRWKKGHHLLDEHGQEQSLGQIGKQHRSWGHGMIWDERKKQTCKTGIVAVRVRHPSYPADVWVVIVRRGGEPWYVLTTRCSETEEQAWECYHAYGRRWQVETVFRFEKSA